MLRIRNWERWQKPFIYEVTRRRKDKAAPVTMRYIALAADLDDEPQGGEQEGNWRRFARLVGPRQAETMLVRVLQYVATKAALTGLIRVSRESFAAVVLSRDLDVVTRADGERVYDALVASEIAEELAGHAAGRSTGDQTGDPPGQSPGQLSGDAPGQTPGEPTGPLHGNLPAYTRAPTRARSVSVDGDEALPQPSPAGEGVGGTSASPLEAEPASEQQLTAGERAAARVIAEAIEQNHVRLEPDEALAGLDRDILGAENARRDASRARDANALAAAEARIADLRRRRDELARERRAAAIAVLRTGDAAARALLERWQGSNALVGPDGHRVPLRVACKAAKDSARADERDRRRDARDREGAA